MENRRSDPAGMSGWLLLCGAALQPVCTHRLRRPARDKGEASHDSILVRGTSRACSALSFQPAGLWNVDQRLLPVCSADLLLVQCAHKSAVCHTYQSVARTFHLQSSSPICAASILTVVSPPLPVSGHRD